MNNNLFYGPQSLSFLLCVAEAAVLKEIIALYGFAFL